MAGKVSFRVGLYIKNPEKLPEIAARARDMRPVFENVIEEWAKDNEDKFRASIGMEASGAKIDPTVFWEALTESTMRSKRRHGSRDQIMVDTGSLRESLTNPSKFFQFMDARKTLFGAPLDADDAMKVQFNSAKRQVIFLSLDDQRMIQKNVVDYLSLGPRYKSIQFSRGMDRLALKNEIAQMDVDFGEAAQ